jgi:predicted branched-subunit amino acid permease
VPCRVAFSSFSLYFVAVSAPYIRPFRSVPSVTELELMTQLFFILFFGWLILIGLLSGVYCDGRQRKKKEKKKKTFLSGSGYT